MSEKALHGSCLCESVRYEVETPFLRFSHCYCRRCRKATGGVRSTNNAVPVDQFRWTLGEELVYRYDLPEARSFATCSCRNCGSPLPHRTRDGLQMIIPAGTLDEEPATRPSAHKQWASRVSWAAIDESHLPVLDGSS